MHLVISAHSFFWQWNFFNSSQNLWKSRYQSFLVESNFNQFLYFVPNIFSTIVCVNSSQCPSNFNTLVFFMTLIFFMPNPSYKRKVSHMRKCSKLKYRVQTLGFNIYIAKKLSENHEYNISELCRCILQKTNYQKILKIISSNFATFQKSFDSSPVKQCIKDLVQELPHELPNDLRFGILDK